MKPFLNVVSLLYSRQVFLFFTLCPLFSVCRSWAYSPRTVLYWRLCSLKNWSMWGIPFSSLATLEQVSIVRTRLSATNTYIAAAPVIYAFVANIRNCVPTLYSHWPSVFFLHYNYECWSVCFAFHFSGKSKILHSLHKAYQMMKRKPVWQDLNPKAVTNDELYGFINPTTREWRDGISMGDSWRQLVAWSLREIVPTSQAMCLYFHELNCMVTPCKTSD